MKKKASLGKRESNLRRQLRTLFYRADQPTGFTGLNSLWKAIKGKSQRKSRPTKNSKIKNRKREQLLKKWLFEQDAYTLHFRRRRKFPRRRIWVSGIGHQMECDLADMRLLKKSNSNYSYILVCIDTFDKKADCRSLKTKKPVEVAKALTDILDNGSVWGKGRSEDPFQIFVDRGGEFKGEFRRLLKSRGIHLFRTTDDASKCANVERFIRTIKSKIYRFLTHRQTERYVDVLPKFIKAYNESEHSSIKMPPNRVSLQNQALVRKNLYGKSNANKSYLEPVLSPRNSETWNNAKIKQMKNWDLHFHVGMRVRIAKSKGPFQKGYKKNYTTETFEIISISTRPAPALYTLQDLAGNIIDGKFYSYELVPVTTTSTLK